MVHDRISSLNHLDQLFESHHVQRVPLDYLELRFGINTETRELLT